MRRERIGKAARTGENRAERASPPQDGPPCLMTAAVLFAFASASLLGAGVVTTQFGLRTVEPLSGASISVPSFTLLFLLASPLILAGEPVVWRGLPIVKLGLEIWPSPLLSAITLRHVRITPRIVAGTVLTVAGVALVLAG
jgi:hypothetical protein